MIVYKLCSVILLALTTKLVSSAPSLNKSPKVSSDLVIAANDDILNDEVPRTSNHSLNSTHFDLKTSSGKVESSTSLTTKQPAIKSKSFNLTSSNTSSISNFTANGSQSTTELINLLLDFFSGIFNAPFEKSTVHSHQASTSSLVATTFSERQSHVSHKHNRPFSVNPFYYISSPSLRFFLPFGRFFRNV
uniref:Uncharacterized protein n=1 Tax=Daphnia galeata TaxID=27404 RepID=A0A8J2RAD7_9CRUS|nr:unnamed protein product [Daphnia galeata]